MRWEHFEHGADVGVRGIGGTLSEAFEGAASALCSLVSGDPASVRPAAEEELTADAPDLESLLVRFLNELISRMSAHRMVYGRISAAVTPGSDGVPARLSARLLGEPIDLDRHEPTVEPKGASFTLARVARKEAPRRAEGDVGRGAQEAGDEWVAQCVVDV